MNSDYNFGMGGADSSNQLCGAYRFDKCMYNYKQWHVIFWWGFQVLLANRYIVYCCFYEQQGLKSMLHYRFQEKVGKHWLDPDYFKDKKCTGTETSEKVQVYQV